ncbi:MAG: glycosyltransferase [Eubacterium sp.]|nr:glycosyltransferase [Eubacterium sp.]
MNKEKVFVSAYACEPHLGSEIGVGWNWVIQMSKYFDLWVLTRKSNQLNIENWLKQQSEPCNIHFVYYDIPAILRFWKKGLRGVRTYYNLWQMATNKIVKKTMKENDIKIYHLLTYGNSLWGASRYGMKQFFVWGPTGGVDLIPRRFVAYYGIKFRIRELIRTMVIKTLPLNIGFQKRCKHANLILCKSESMYEAIPEQYRSKAKLFTDCAVNGELLQENVVEDRKEIQYITVGRLDAWRNFDVLIEAFCLAYQEKPNIRLDIVGEGRDENRLKSLIRIRGMEQIIHMTGQVSMNRYYEMMRNADVVVNSSYKEGAVTMAFDSMAMGKPLICIETGGYTKHFSESSAMILPRGERKDLIESLRRAILSATDLETRKTMSREIYKIACEKTWEKKGKEICREIMTAYSGKKEES